MFLFEEEIQIYLSERSWLEAKMIVDNKKAIKENNRDLTYYVAFLYITVGNAQCAKIWK